MNSGPRRLLQRWYEFPILRRMGVTFTRKDVLEIGCGSGYAAQLILLEGPKSYVGVDVMPEQLALARRRGLSAAEFRLEDATHLASVPTASIDLVAVFGILHHIPEWRRAVAECRRVLRPGGEVYLEEPDGGAVGWFESSFVGDTHARPASGCRPCMLKWSQTDLSSWGATGPSVSASTAGGLHGPPLRPEAKTWKTRPSATFKPR